MCTCLTVGLALIVLWWNDNPLYGGQAETAIPAVFIGVIAGLAGTLAAGRARAARVAPNPPDAWYGDAKVTRP